MKWISAKDELPKENCNVIIYCYNNDNGVITNYVDAAEFYRCPEFGNYWFCDLDYEGTEIRGVTHWMPLPEPPK